MFASKYVGLVLYKKYASEKLHCALENVFIHNIHNSSINIVLQ